MPRPKSFDPSVAMTQIMRVFWEKGFESTSIADLEEATGLNKRSLYNTFGNKQALFAAALERYLGNMGSVAACLGREPLGVHNIKAFFGAMTYTADSLGCLLTKTANEKSVVPKDAYANVQSAILHTESMLHDNLAADIGVAKAREIAPFLTATIQGITTMANVDPDPKRLRAVVDVVNTTLDAALRRRRNKS